MEGMLWGNNIGLQVNHTDSIMTLRPRFVNRA